MLSTGTPWVGCQERLGLLPKGERVPALQGDTSGASHHPDPWLREGIGKDCVICFCSLLIGLWSVMAPCTIDTFVMALVAALDCRFLWWRAGLLSCPETRLYFLQIIYLTRLFLDVAVLPNTQQSTVESKWQNSHDITRRSGGCDIWKQNCELTFLHQLYHGILASIYIVCNFIFIFCDCVLQLQANCPFDRARVEWTYVSISLKKEHLDLYALVCTSLT
jgi:hypothetical protein